MRKSICLDCGAESDVVGERTEVLEQYMDGIVAEPDHPRHVPLRARQMVPGRVFLTLSCGHEAPA